MRRFVPCKVEQYQRASPNLRGSGAQADSARPLTSIQPWMPRQTGYRAAFAACRGYLQPDTHLFAIPRIGTREDWTRFQSRITQAW